MIDTKDVTTKDRPLRIVGIGGSMRSNSVSLLVARRLLERMSKLGVEVTLLDMRSLELPFCCGDKSYSYPAFPDVVQVRTALSQADGIVVAVPEYHGGPSGIIKNLFDLLDNELQGKVAAIVSVLGGEYSNNTLNQMRLILRHMHTLVLPEQVAIAHSKTAFSDIGEPLNESINERLDKLTDALLQGCHRMCTSYQGEYINARSDSCVTNGC